MFGVVTRCPFMCNGLICARPLKHRGVHHAVHPTVPGVPSLDVKLWWDDMWCDQETQVLAERMALEVPEGEA